MIHSVCEIKIVEVKIPVLSAHWALSAMLDLTGSGFSHFATSVNLYCTMYHISVQQNLTTI